MFSQCFQMTHFHCIIGKIGQRMCVNVCVCVQDHLLCCCLYAHCTIFLDNTGSLPVSQYVFLPFSLSLSLFILSCYVWKLARPVRGVQVQTNRPGRLNIAGSDSREHCAPPSLAVVLGTAASLQTTLMNLNCYLHAHTHARTHTEEVHFLPKLWHTRIIHTNAKIKGTQINTHTHTIPVQMGFT